jgi:hypothetical protein
VEIENEVDEREGTKEVEEKEEKREERTIAAQGWLDKGKTKKQEKTQRIQTETTQWKISIFSTNLTCCISLIFLFSFQG